MVFSSLKFIFVFLPIFFACYYLTKPKGRNVVLFLGSLVFYIIGSVEHPVHLAVLLISVLMDFTSALIIEKNKRIKKPVMFINAGAHLAAFITFRYTDLVMPVGISFYTFQGISYVADVYRGKIKAERSLISFGAYICMFEQLIAGPIVTFSHVQDRLHNRNVNIFEAVDGFNIFVFGLGLKVLLANPLGNLWGDITAIGYESISTQLAWVGAVAFSFQIYFDFFGYSLMAIGLGKMLGFEIPKNFDMPYISKTMTEFWRRWHITLGSWFRDYVYIPLGGNRVSFLTNIGNLFIVWTLTGMWHGASLNFIIWGLSLFVIIVCEKYIYGRFMQRFSLIGHLYMIFLIPVTWSIFAVDDLGQLITFFSRLFPFFGEASGVVMEGDYIKYLSDCWPFLAVGAVLSTREPFKLLKKVNKLVMTIVLLIIFAASCYCMYIGLDDPFLYFRF